MAMRCSRRSRRLLALAEQKIAHARCVIVIEACEESGSYDLPAYIDHLADRIGTPSLVVCLDSGCGDYERLWLTTSLRGIAMGTLTVRVLTEGVHSGDASGIVPSSFRILRQCLSRIEDEATGEIKLTDLFVQVPPDRLEQAKQSAKILGEAVYSKMPFAGDTKPMSGDLTELVLNRTWRPQLAVTGMEGYPLAGKCGQCVAAVFHRQSFRCACRPLAMAKPPRKASSARSKPMRPIMRKSFSMPKAGKPGGTRPCSNPGSKNPSRVHRRPISDKPAAYMGEGGSIPFMAMLGEKFPRTQFVVTGVLGPHSNAHGPNEFLHIPTAKKVSAAIATILADHARR